MSQGNILFLTNNQENLVLYRWLKSLNEQVFLYQNKLSLETIKAIAPYLIISYGYRYLIKEEIISYVKGNIINLHISLLPWNRGAYPNFWSFIEDTPKGVTIHYIDRGLDTGDIIIQKEIFFNEDYETLATSYKKLNITLTNLFKENWGKIKNFEFEAFPQEEGGSIHYIKEFNKISFLIKEKGWDTPIWELKQKYKRYLNNEL